MEGYGLRSPTKDPAVEAVHQDLAQTRAYLEHLHLQMTSLSRDVATLSSDVKSIFIILQSKLGPNSPLSSATAGQLRVGLHEPPAKQIPLDETPTDEPHRPNAPVTTAKVSTPDSVIPPTKLRPPTNASGNPVVGILKNSATGSQIKTPPLHRVDFVQETTRSAPSSSELKTRLNAVTSRSRSYADIFANASDYQGPDVTSAKADCAYDGVRRSQTGNSFHRIHSSVSSPQETPHGVRMNDVSGRAVTGSYGSRNERDLDEGLNSTSTRGDSGIDVGKEMDFGSRSTILSTDL